MKSDSSFSPASIDLLTAAAGARFKTILADPPWRFQNKTGKVAPEHRRLSRYATWLWRKLARSRWPRSRPRRRIFISGVRMRFCRTDCVSCPTGDLPTKPILSGTRSEKTAASDGRGVGFYFRNVTELILFGTRGKNARTLPPGRRQVNYLATRKREHSRKPDEQYKLIESCSPGPYLELFGRGVRPGWVTWGDQADDSYQPAWNTYAHNSSTDRTASIAADRRD